MSVETVLNSMTLFIVLCIIAFAIIIKKNPSPPKKHKKDD